MSRARTPLTAMASKKAISSNSEPCTADLSPRAYHRACHTGRGGQRVREIVLMLALAAGPADSVHQAERLATAALAAPPAKAAASLDQARRALALTADFDPTVFVRAGR